MSMDLEMAEVQVNVLEEKELVSDDLVKLPSCVEFINAGAVSEATIMEDNDSGGSSSKENRSTPAQICGDVASASYPDHPRSPENKLDQPDEDADAENEIEGVRRKRRGRRGRIKGGRHHNRKWKPYDKLSWSERRALEERETIRATWKREEAFKSGHPFAPYNTTQFLINDHSSISPNLQMGGGPVSGASVDGEVAVGEASLGVMYYRECSGSGVDSDSEFYESPNDEETFLTKDFSETYDNMHAERLENMTKEQLIHDYVELESKVEQIEGQLKERENTTVSKTVIVSSPLVNPPLLSSVTVSSVANNQGEEKKSLSCSCSETVMNLRLEISKLLQENDRLLLENLRLRDSQSQSSSTLS